MKGHRPTAYNYLDKRIVNKDGRHPVRLKVTYKRKPRFYSTGYSATEEEMSEIRSTGDKTTKPRRGPEAKKRWERLNKVRIELEKIEEEAKRVLETISEFSFEKFEEEFFNKKADEQDVFSLFNTMISEYREAGKQGTRSSYECSRNSLLRFLREKKGKKKEEMPFEDITSKLLKEYEKWMIEDLGNERTTVGIYTRTLRAVFNRAIREGITQSYPFGSTSEKFQPPNSVKTKKALTFDQVKTLYNAEPKTSQQEIAKDWFLLSYAIHGVNLKDLAELKNKNIEGETIKFYRSKSFDTSRRATPEIPVKLTDFTLELINKYRNNSEKEDDYVFSVFEPSDSSEEKDRKVGNFDKFINQHLKKLAFNNGLPKDISYQWARHTFATFYYKHTKSLGKTSEALGHSDITTTQNYLHTFDEEDQKEIMEAITNLGPDGENN